MADLSMTEVERNTLLAEPHVAVLAVSSGNERPPLAVPVFYRYEAGGNFTFFTNTQGRTSRKLDLIKVAGVVRITVQDEQFPYKYVSAEATLVSIEQPPKFEGPYEIVRRYMPDEHARGFVEAELGLPESIFTLVTVKPTRWSSQDISKGM